MSRLEETAYPRLKAEFTPQELEAIYTPSADEQALIASWYRRAPIRACLLIQLKVLQRLGYFVPLAATPPAIVEHVCRHANLGIPTKTALKRYDQSGSKSRHQQRLREHVGLRALDKAGERWLVEVALDAANTKQELPDIINVLVEELVRGWYELPGFTVLDRMAERARSQVNAAIYQATYKSLSRAAKERLDELMQSRRRGAWDSLKREPKRPGVREIANFLGHIDWLIDLADGLPQLKTIAVPKRMQMVLEARALDVAKMRRLPADKRYTLSVLLIQAQLKKAMDDVAEIFIKVVRNLHRLGEERLQQYHLEHVQQVDRLIGQFRDVLAALQDEHGDTQAQSAPVFGLAHLLGIQLMPRIRNIKQLVFFKPDRRTQYRHINDLFKGTIDWDLIARHVPDILRVAISIKAGRITPSMILRRLGTFSRKNKLYFAFRELGRVVRTMFLLNYINDLELRRTINAATNKSEEFNNFTKWLFFGGEGIIAENVRHEQRKIIKYNHLVANLVILHNVQSMSQRLKDLQQQGYDVDEDVLKALSPYRTSHINRFGDYTLDLDRQVPPMDYSIRFEQA